MYAIASPTVPIFSALSSGIEIPNSFSNSFCFVNTEFVYDNSLYFAFNF